MTHLFSVLCVLMKLLSHASAKIKRKRLKAFKFGPFMGRFQMTSLWRGYRFCSLQVSYSSGSPSLSDKKSYPLFGRVAASGTVTNPARVSFIRHFGWTRVATIHQSYESFSEVSRQCSATFSKVSGQFPATFSKVSGQFPATFSKVSGQCSATFSKVSGQFPATFSKVSGQCSARSLRSVDSSRQRSLRSVDSARHVL